jgi:hypothetical protein
MLVGRILFFFDRAQNHYHALDDMFAAICSRYKARREMYVRAEANVFSEVLREGQQSGALEVDDPGEVAHALVWATSTLPSRDGAAHRRRPPVHAAIAFALP